VLGLLSAPTTGNYEEQLPPNLTKQDTMASKELTKEGFKQQTNPLLDESKFSKTFPSQIPLNYNYQLQQQHKYVSRGPKLTFPDFDGTDPDGWIRKAEKYFELVGVPSEQRVQIIVLYLQGRAEYWWRGTGCNPHTLLWHHFYRVLGDRFNQTSEYEIIGQFHDLKQTGSVMEYVDKFEEMLSQVRRYNPSLNDAYYISTFISGLKEYIQCHLQCHRPTALSHAYWYAKRLEQANLQPKKNATFINMPRPKPWVRDIDGNQDKEVKPQQTIAELKAAGKCFKCKESWVPGHTKVCKSKQLYSVILTQNSESKEEMAVIQEEEESDNEYHDAQIIHTLKISMHALNGSPSKASTFTPKLQFGSKTAIALVDSGSDASFINAKLALKNNYPIVGVLDRKPTKGSTRSG
jgi:hypothetical protein